MAQTKKKRRRKHSGTQAGTIERQPRQARPQTKEEKREEARRRRLERLDQPPTLRGAVLRAAIASLIFLAMVLLVFRESIPNALILAVFTFALYIPIGYFTDTFFYNRRQQQLAKKRGGGG